MSVRRLPTKSPRWEVVLELGVVDGTRKQRRINRDPDTGLPIPTKREALRIERDAITRRHRPGYVDPSRTTVAAYLDRWLAETAETRAEGTHYNWASIIEKRLKPHVGAVMLADLSARHIEAMWKALCPRHTLATMQTTRMVLSGAMRTAIRWRLLERNPVSEAVMPRQCKGERERKAWTPEQARTLLAHTDGTDAGVLWRFLFDSGLRLGEALALTWRDVDLDAGTVRVARTVSTNGSGQRVVVERTKTKSSRRDLTINAETVEALRKHRLRQKERRLGHGAYWREANLIFDRGDGGLLDENQARRALQLDCAAAGVPYVTPHGVRRSSITIAVASGASLHAVSRRAGHKRLSMTSDVYAMRSEDADREVSETLRRAVEG
jgi:integrase